MNKEDPQLSRWFSEHNKLRQNNINIPGMAMKSIADTVKHKFPELYGRLQKLIPIDLYVMAGSYITMTFEEKEAFAKRLDNASYKFLEELSK